jgi:hypothetical protein
VAATAGAGHAATSGPAGPGNGPLPPASAVAYAGHTATPSTVRSADPTGLGGTLAYTATAAGPSGVLAWTAQPALTRVGAPGSIESGGARSPQRSVFPSAPAPTPAPLTGGGSPSSAEAPGSGFLILLGLAGLLLLGAPSVARRLRLAGESWSVPAFVLIPERPG